METANVGSKKKTVTTNMVVTRPGEKGLEITANNQIIDFKDYLEEVGNVKVGLLNNSERDLRAYLAKYDPEKLKEYEAKKVRDGKEDSEMTI